MQWQKDTALRTFFQRLLKCLCLEWDTGIFLFCGERFLEFIWRSVPYCCSIFSSNASHMPYQCGCMTGIQSEFRFLNPDVTNPRNWFIHAINRFSLPPATRVLSSTQLLCACDNSGPKYSSSWCLQCVAFTHFWMSRMVLSIEARQLLEGA